MPTSYPSASQSISRCGGMSFNTRCWRSFLIVIEKFETFGFRLFHLALHKQTCIHTSTHTHKRTEFWNNFLPCHYCFTLFYLLILHSFCFRKLFVFVVVIAVLLILCLLLFSAFCLFGIFLLLPKTLLQYTVFTL